MLLVCCWSGMPRVIRAVWHDCDLVKQPTILVRGRGLVSGYLSLDVASRTLMTLPAAVAGREGSIPGKLDIHSHPEDFIQSLVHVALLPSSPTPPHLYTLGMLGDIIQHCNDDIVTKVMHGTPRSDVNKLLTVLEVMDDGNYSWLKGESLLALDADMHNNPANRERFATLPAGFHKYLNVHLPRAVKHHTASSRGRLMLDKAVKKPRISAFQLP